jgi:hypothetical protein
MIRRAKEVSERCLSQCVQVSGTSLSALLLAALGSPLPPAGVVAVRSEIDAIAKRLETLDAELERFFPLKKVSSTMLSGMDRSGGYEIFSRRSRLTSHIVPAKQPIFLAVLKFMLKSGIEYTRSRTLTKSELHQTQVDVQYLRRLVGHFLEDSTITNPMLDELQNSAADRCGEPLLLDPAVRTYFCGTLFLTALLFYICRL